MNTTVPRVSGLTAIEAAKSASAWIQRDIWSPVRRSLWFAVLPLPDDPRSCRWAICTVEDDGAVRISHYPEAVRSNPPGDVVAGAGAADWVIRDNERAARAFTVESRRTMDVG